MSRPSRKASAAEVGLPYPYDGLTLVEVPNSLRGFGGGWRMDTAMAPPAMLLKILILSSVGGWVVTLGAGQASSYYGDACDLVISQEYVTPAGSFKTLDYPGTATGPRVNDIMMGSEGTFGILTNVTLRISRYTPENTRRFSYMFRTWEDGLAAVQEVMEG